jgi:transcriptional regulator with XRE-family HTH domain
VTILGENLKKLRERAGFTVRQLSEQSGVSKSVISEIESDKYEPSIRFINAMMLRFGANPEWIMTGEGGMFISPEDYIAKGIELLGPETMSKGFLTVLKDRQFAEFQPFLSMDKFKREQHDDELQELLQQVSRVWQQGDERTRWTMEQFVKAFIEGEGKVSK